MHRIMAPGLAMGDVMVRVEGDEAHHALRVKRVRVGEGVEVFNGAGAVAAGRIAEAGRSNLTVQLTEAVRMSPRSRPWIEVWACPPKGSHLDLLVDGLAQVGAGSLTLLRTPWSQPMPSASRMSRLERIAVESSKQCGRAWVMPVKGGGTLEAALVGEEGLTIVMAHPEDGAFSPEGGGKIRLLIGPEGGWQESELAQARAAGAKLCGFGPHLMRIEIAAVAAVVSVRERGG